MNTTQPSLRAAAPSWQHTSADDIIRAAELPAPIATLISTLIRQTRLRRVERAELAQELCAHFADGLASGQSAADLLRDFGDPVHASRLIAAAVKRKRSWRFHLLRRTLQACAAFIVLLIIVYAWLFARYHLRAPTIARNYTAEYNDRFQKLPEAQRAWPIYRDLMAKWRFPAPDLGATLAFDTKSADWPATRAYVNANATLLPALRAAANRPALGALLAPDEDADVSAFLRHFDPSRVVQPFAVPLPDPHNPPVVGTLIPELSVARVYSRALIVDLVAAFQDRDPGRVIADARAVLGICRQLRDQHILIGDLIAIALTTNLDQAISRSIIDRAPDWSDAQLAELAHTLASTNVPRISFEGERLAFDDVLQRSFSDDGSGDGSLLASGLTLFSQIQRTSTDPASPTKRRLDDFAGPAAAAAVASRRTLHEMFNQSIDRAESIASMPLWTRTDQDNADADVIRLFETGSPLTQLHYLPLKLFLPALGHAAVQVEYTQQIHDATLVAIALEIHKKRQGAYPASLAELVPTLLPAIPPDRYTGKPLNYILRDQRPVLYSVGVDRTDNQGIPPPGEDGNLMAQVYRSPLTAQAILRNLAADPKLAPDIRGDWLLHPAP